MGAIHKQDEELVLQKQLLKKLREVFRATACGMRYSACLFVAKALAIGFSQIGAYLGIAPKYFASTF